MQTNKGILTDEALQKIAEPFASLADGYREWEILREVRDTQHQATLDHLAKVKDEELRAKVSLIIINKIMALLAQDKALFEEDCKSLNLSPTGFSNNVADTIFAAILPILSARHQKEMQEAVGKARDNLHDYYVQQIELACIEERKAIGKVLNDALEKTRKPSQLTNDTVVDFDLWGKNIHGHIIKLLDGQSPPW